LQIRLNIMVMV